jgi:hypothetical protein
MVYDFLSSIIKCLCKGLIKSEKMNKINFDPMPTLRWTNDECTFLSTKVFTGENKVNYLITSSAVMYPLLEFITRHPWHQISYKPNEDGVLELYYTSPKSGVLQKLKIGGENGDEIGGEIEGEIVSFKFLR